MTPALLIILAGTSTATVDRLIQRAVAGEEGFPSLAEAQEAAVRALELTPSDEVEDWAFRSRWRGLVPRLDARLGTDTDHSFKDGGTSVWTTSEAQKLGVDVGARFELGELVFNDMELRANRERIARAARIALVRDRVTKVYFERLRVWLLLREEPTVDLVVRAAELDGMLRAITGGLLDDEGRMQ